MSYFLKLRTALNIAVFSIMTSLTVINNPLECKAFDPKTNVVLILADDLGIGDVKCYGGNRCQIDTPHIDALAKGGLRFTNAYVNASVCIPTRVAIMTGRYPWRFDVASTGGRLGFLSPQFDTETLTLGKLFQREGFRTGYVGKWHLGTVMTTMDGKAQNKDNVDYIKSLKIGPLQYGFDDSFILPGSLDMYPYAFVRNNLWQGEVSTQKGWSAFNRIGPAEKDFQDHAVLETLYREAETFIGKQSKAQPFFLYVALTAPHTPISPSQEWRGKSRLGLYGDFVMEVDYAIERVLNALKQKGFYNDTLVLFSSDHGAAPYAGNIRKATPGQIRMLEEKGHYSSGPHRGYKFSVYEGGLHIPLIAHWPKIIPPGTECDSLVGLNDLMATLGELTGSRIGSEDAPDSLSFAKLLKVPYKKGVREHLVMQSAGAFAVREGDWKLCLCPGCGSSDKLGNAPSSEDAWREALVRFGKSPKWNDLTQAPFVQLFNLENDPHEDHNIAAENPKIVSRLVTLLRRQIQLGRSTPGPTLMNDRKSINIIQVLPDIVLEELREQPSASENRF